VEATSTRIQSLAPPYQKFAETLFCVARVVSTLSTYPRSLPKGGNAPCGTWCWDLCRSKRKVDGVVVSQTELSPSQDKTRQDAITRRISRRETQTKGMKARQRSNWIIVTVQYSTVVHADVFLPNAQPFSTSSSSAVPPVLQFTLPYLTVPSRLLATPGRTSPSSNNASKTTKELKEAGSRNPCFPENGSSSIDTTVDSLHLGDLMSQPDPPLGPDLHDRIPSAAGWTGTVD